MMQSWAIARPVGNRAPDLKRLVKRMTDFLSLGRRVSFHNVQLDDGVVAKEFCRLRAACQSQGLIVRQRELVDTQLAVCRRDEPFDIMTRALRYLPSDWRFRSPPRCASTSSYPVAAPHISGYKADGVETAGVVRCYVIFDRTPLALG